jgi:hypothetical protein
MLPAWPMAQGSRSLHEPLHDYRAEILEDVALRPGSEVDGFVRNPSVTLAQGDLHYRLRPAETSRLASRTVTLVLLSSG